MILLRKISLVCKGKLIWLPGASDVFGKKADAFMIAIMLLYLLCRCKMIVLVLSPERAVLVLVLSPQGAVLVLVLEKVQNARTSET